MFQQFGSLDAHAYYGCCGLQLKRLKLRKNIWDCETYQFDEVLTETASQKRVYEVVAKPVVEVISSSLCLYPLA